MARPGNDDSMALSCPTIGLQMHTLPNDILSYFLIIITFDYLWTIKHSYHTNVTLRSSRSLASHTIFNIIFLKYAFYNVTPLFSIYNFIAISCVHTTSLIRLSPTLSDAVIPLLFINHIQSYTQSLLKHHSIFIQVISRVVQYTRPFSYLIFHHIPFLFIDFSLTTKLPTFSYFISLLSRFMAASYKALFSFF